MLAVKVFPSEAHSEADGRDTLAALDWISVSHPEVRVVNLSLGGEPQAAPCDTASAVTLAYAYASAVAALRARGVTVVASAGNDGSTTGIGAPACIADALSVGAVYDAGLGEYATDVCTDATTAADQVACYSNGGEGVDLLAPGPGTTTPKTGGGTDEFGGTSAAAPYVAGAVALLLEARPLLGPAQIEAALRQGGRPVVDARTGRLVPRLDVRAAADLLPSLADAPPRATLPAGSAEFADAVGDSGGGADIAGARVTTAGDGVLTFTLAIPNRASLATSDAVQVFVDADRNAATGSSTGAEYAVVAFADSDAQVHRWAGSWQLQGVLDAAMTGGRLTLTLDQARIGGDADFSFVVVSFASGTSVDVAPAGGSWPFPAHPLAVARTGTESGAVSGGGANGVDCGARCSAALGRGAGVTLTATAAPGSVFAAWGGACTGATCSLTMDGRKEVTARFELLRRLAVARVGTGVGTVVSAPRGDRLPDELRV